jgi:hypothetical protein
VPWRIGIVSTGLIVNGDDAAERGALAAKRFGVVILDEAHKARVSRRTRDGGTEATPNNLMTFLRKVAEKAGSVLLGTATPIQLEAVELWDLVSGLGQGAPQVLGSPFNGAEWWREASIQYLSGDRPWPQGDTARWGLFRNPMPPAAEHAVFRDIRDDAALPSRQVVGPRFDELRPDMRSAFVDEFQALPVRISTAAALMRPAITL